MNKAVKLLELLNTSENLSPPSLDSVKASVNTLKTKAKEGIYKATGKTKEGFAKKTKVVKGVRYNLVLGRWRRADSLLGAAKINPHKITTSDVAAYARGKAPAHKTVGTRVTKLDYGHR